MNQAHPSFPFDLVISAAAFEASPLVEAARSSLRWNGDYLDCGIGSLDAAYRATEIGKRSQGKRVLFIGTCGIFGEFSDLSALHVAEVHWLPTAERQERAYRVQGTCPPITLLDKTSGYFRSYAATNCLCSPSISFEGGISPAMRWEAQRRTRVCTENLELYPVAHGVMPHCQSFDAVLITTNAIGPDAHREWRRNFRRAAELTRDHILEAVAK